MPQFDVGFYASQLFWLAVTFACLYFLVSKFIVPKAESILVARSRCFEDNIRYADEYNEKAKFLHDSRTEALEEIDVSVKEAQKQALDILEENFRTKRAEIEKEIKKEKDSAEKEIADYVKNFRAEESASSVELAGFIIEKVTKKPVDLKLLQKLQERQK
jgi:F-type H+-transporting ATPase subunit b